MKLKIYVKMKLSLNHKKNLRIDVQKSGFEKILEKK